MASIHIKTYGCAFNQAESESMAGLLAYAGHQIVDTEQDAELVIINSCTVKGKAEAKLFEDLRKLGAKGKRVVVAGCVPQAEQSYVTTKLAQYSIVGTKSISKITYAVDETLHGNRVVFLIPDVDNPRLNLPKIRRNPLVEIIPINEGCLSRCAFCKTKQARGNLLSYDPQAILQHARSAIADGVQELWLTSQDTATYGFDIKTNIAELLVHLCALDGDFMIRVGMGNPTYYLKQLKPLIKAFQHPKVYKFLHVPIQAGDDDVLKEMHRGYTVAQFFKIIDAFRAAIPGITIATDVIVGYPTESEVQFKNTLKVVEQLQPDVCNISRYWRRPGTPAAALPELSPQVVKRRTKELTECFKRISAQRNRQWIGWQGEILINEEGKAGTGTWVGRNPTYKPIVLKGNYCIGDRVQVEIEKATVWDLRATAQASR